jgi:hypothetical protein
MAFRPTVEQWRSLIQRLAPDLPIEFVLAWIDHESGGNPCSTGVTTAAMFEAGIAQTNHPSDNIFGATAEQLRTMCSGQTQVRPMTDAERLLHAQVAVNAIRAFKQRAQQRLAAVGASWPESSIDFWNFVKLGHGLPAMQVDLMRQITSSLGRPPRSWDEYRGIVMAMSPGQFPASLVRFATAPSVRGLQNRIADVLVNAETAGKHGGGISLGIGLALVGAGALALVYLIRRRKRG